MRKNIKEVVEAFLAKKAKSHASCSTNGNEIFSYALMLCRRGPDNEILLATKESCPRWSNTTAQQYNAVEWALSQEPGLVVKKVSHSELQNIQ